MSGASFTLGHFPDGEREPDAIEFAVMAWLDNNGLDLIANDLHACIEDRFTSIKKRDFIKYAINYVRSLRDDCAYEAYKQLSILNEHWFDYLTLYRE
jgi:hypothetical protein